MFHFGKLEILRVVRALIPGNQDLWVNLTPCLELVGVKAAVAAYRKLKLLYFHLTRAIRVKVIEKLGYCVHVHTLLTLLYLN